MNIRKKMVLFGAGQMLVLALILFAVSFVNNKELMLNADVQKARAVVMTTEAVREQMGEKWAQGLITTQQLQAWAQQGDQDKIVGSVPVVTAWKAAKAKAREEGYEFRVPKFQPRNPDNQPDAFESRVLHKFESENLAEYYEIDKERNAVRYFRPIRLTQECMYCHGNPATSKALWGNDRGEDPTGAKMENWKVGEVHGAFEVIQSLDAMDQELASEVWTQLGIVVVVLGVGIFAFVTFINRGLNRPLSHLLEGVARMAHGDTSTKVTVLTADELGQLSQSFNEMVDQIAKGQQEVQAALQEATVKAAVVENTPTNIIVADKEFNITYLNPQSLKTFREISEVLPCRPEEILGKNIDFFHKNPAHQRRILADPKSLPHRANITLGGETLDLMASAIYDQRGEYVGMMVNWEVITERLRLAEEVRQRAEESESKRQQMLVVAEEVLNSAKVMTRSAEALSGTASSLGEASQQQKGIVDDTAAAIEEMAATARSVSSNTDNLARLVTENSAALNELAASVVSVSQNSERMNQAVMTNSSSIEELAASIQAQAQNADQANQTAQQASQAAQEGAQVVRQAIEGMSRIAERVRASAATISELGKSSEQISTIVAVINDIADQTNLLALNAAIEAARAGEQGRGFAVVADEVRKLAERTSKATQEIDGMIGKIQRDTQEVVTSMGEGVKEVEQGTQLASRSGEALAQIGRGVGQVNELMGQLSQATREQAKASDQIVGATMEMNELVQQVTHAMGEQSQAVDVVSQSSEEMRNLVDGVARSMKEQSSTAEHMAQSMGEVNRMTQEALFSVQEMNTATADLANQAEALKQLAGSFEDDKPA